MSFGRVTCSNPFLVPQLINPSGKGKAKVCYLLLSQSSFPLLQSVEWPQMWILQVELSWVELSLYYGRRSVDQFVLVSGSPLGPMTRFYPFLSLVTFVLMFFLTWPVSVGTLNYRPVLSSERAPIRKNMYKSGFIFIGYSLPGYRTVWLYIEHHSVKKSYYGEKGNSKLIYQWCIYSECDNSSGDCFVEWENYTLEY
jgi:hypothetical protein